MVGPVASETHISTLFFSEDRVFKLLKPIDNGFLDHRDAAVRMAAVSREVELNRRNAPDVYLGTADVVEGGVAVDRMIVMRRLPAERSLTSIIQRGELTVDLIHEVARDVAVFHAALDPICEVESPGCLDAHRDRWESNFATLAPFVGEVLDPATDEAIADLARNYIAGHEPLFARRIADGNIRDGHGDLLADDIFCMDDGPRILDCLAFRDDFRVGDVLSDIAFLAMDLHRLAGPQAARELLRSYSQLTGEHHPSSLAHHYVAYRAHVRCKVECLRWAQGAPERAAVARMYHRLTLDQLERARARLVLIGGGPGTGKTTIADRLATTCGWSVLSSDVVRKNLAEVELDAHAAAEPDTGLYTQEMTIATYRELLDEAAATIEHGDSVILDASWTHVEDRAAAAKVAEQHRAELIEIECVVSPSLARERVARRLADSWNPSDATPEIVDHLQAQHDPWPTAETIATDGPIASSVNVAHAIAMRPYGGAGRTDLQPVIDFWGAFLTERDRGGFTTLGRASRRRT